MKKNLALLSAIFLGSQFLGALGAETSFFLKGNASYEAGQFKQASDFYEKGLEAKETSAAIYFNLGNAYFRQNRTGEALLAYRRAEALTPRDEALCWNISILQATFKDHITEVSGNPFWFYLDRVVSRVTLGETSFCFSLLVLLFFTLSALSFIYRPFQKWSAVPRAFLIISILVTLIFLGYKASQERNPKVVILDKEVTARFGPSLKETVAFRLHEGAEAIVTDTIHDWYYVTLANQSSGWIPKKTCEVV